MSTGNSQWSAQGAGGLYGTFTTTGGGGSITVSARDALDFARLGSPGKTPEAEYPDGFLGSVPSRRSDRLTDKIGKMNRRSYTRGVHRGERIDPGDYLWTPDWNPETGIETQMSGMRQSLVADGPEPTLTRIRSVAVPTGNDARVGQLSSLLPSWR